MGLYLGLNVFLQKKVLSFLRFLNGRPNVRVPEVGSYRHIATHIASHIHIVIHARFS